MSWWTGPTAAAIRSWAIDTGRPVGARGAISTALRNEYAVAMAKARLLKTGRLAARIALEVGPELRRARSERGRPS